MTTTELIEIRKQLFTAWTAIREALDTVIADKSSMNPTSEAYEIAAMLEPLESSLDDAMFSISEKINVEAVGEAPF